MTRAEIRAEVRALLNDESATSPRFTDAKLNNRINEIHKHIANATGVLKSSATNTLAINVGEYTIPEATDVLDMERVEIVDNTDTTTLRTYPLKPSSMEDLDYRSLRWKDLRGEPSEYYLRGNRLGVVPAPDTPQVGWTLRIYYAEKESTLDDDTDIPRYPNQYHKIVVWGVVEWCKREDNDYEESQLYRAMFERELAIMKAQTDTRKGTMFKMKPGNDEL